MRNYLKMITKYNTAMRIATMIIFLFGINLSYAQTDLKLGTTPGTKNPSAVLELESTNKGFLLPRMTTAQMNAIDNPALGLMVYNTDLNCIHFYLSGWKSQCDPANLGAWSLLGNLGINSDNFLGTINDASLRFRTNNTERMILDSTGILLLGTTTRQYVDAGSAIPAYLVVGGDAVINGITVGRGSGQSGVNTAFGNQALFNNTSGSYNTALGYRALTANTSGSFNTAVGNALIANTTGIMNVAFGEKSVRNNTTGCFNTGLGYQALNSNTTGNYNIGIGMNAGYNITSGHNNIAIGFNSYLPSATDSNQLNIGNLIFGSGLLGTYTNPLGNIGIGTTTPQYRLDVASLSAGNPLRLQGLQAGATSDSILTSLNGVVRRLAPINNTAWTLTGNSGTSWASNFLGTTDSVGLRFRTSNTERMVIDSLGRVGIGTNTPSKQFEVAVNNASNWSVMARMNNTNTAGWANLEFSENGSQGGWIGLGGSTNTYANIRNRFIVSGWTDGVNIMGNNDIRFYTSGWTNTGYERMRINSIGNIGIGTLSPMNKLDIGGSVVIGTRYAGINTAPTNGLLVQGNIGINTTNPLYKLDINADSASAGNPLRLLGLQAGATTDSLLTSASGVVRRLAPINNTAWTLTGNSGTSWASNFLGTTDNTSLRFRTNNTQRMIVDSVGRIGVGTNTPFQKLSVAGDFSTQNNTYDVLKVGPLVDPAPSTITVKTNILSSINKSPQIRVKIYGYFNTYGNSDLSINTYVYPTVNTFLPSATYFNSNMLGGYVPSSIRIGTWNDGGVDKIAIEIANDSRYWTSYNFEAYNHSNLTKDELTGWTYTLSAFDGAISNITNVAQKGSIIASTTGNIGINTINPLYKLDINADSASAGNPLRLLGLQAGATTDSLLTSQSGVVKRLAINQLGTGNFWKIGGNTEGGVRNLGTTDNYALPFLTNNVERMRISETGTVNIGFTNPTLFDFGHQLNVKSHMVLKRFNLAPNYVQTRYNGTETAITGVLAGQQVGALTFEASDGASARPTLANLLVWAAENTTATAAGGEMTFTTTPIGSTTPLERMRISSAGNVGIGTTTPTARLHVGGFNAQILADSAIVANKGGSRFYVGSGGITHLGFGWENVGVYNTFKSAASNNNSLELNMKNGATDYFHVNGAFRTSYETKLAMTSGNVGIGIGASVTPAYKLDIDANTGGTGNPLRLQGLQAGATSDSLLTSLNGVVRRLDIASAVATNAWILTGNSGTTAGTNFIGTTDNIDFVTKTNGTERIRIKNSGNILLGTSTDNGYRLQINGNGFHSYINASTNSALRHRLINSTDGRHVIEMTIDGTNWYNGVHLYNGILGFGNNGMGVDGTALRIHSGRTLVDNIDFGTNMATPGPNNYKAIRGDGQSLKTIIGGATAGNYRNDFTLGGKDIFFETGGSATYSSETTKMTIKDSGNVGIGTTTPSYKLDIDANTGSAGNPLRLQGLQAGATSDSILTSASGVVRRMAFSSLLSNSLTVSNGLTMTSNNIKLGGTLSEATTIATAGNNVLLTGAGSLAVGTASPTSTLHIAGSVSTAFRRVTANVTVGNTDHIVLVNCTSGTVTMTLPAASTCSGREYIIGKTDETANALSFSVALKLTESTTVSSISFAKKYKIVSDGTDWWIVNE